MLKSIAIMTSGGDSPGMNAAARAVVRTALYEGVKVFGIYDGYKGMLEDRIVELNSQSVSDIIQRGGTFLGTARCPEFKQEETRKEALKILQRHGIEGWGSDYTIGADTALNTILDAINKLRDTASAHRRIIVLEVMGRECGWLAMMAGIAGGAEYVLVPEVKYDLNKICDELKTSYDNGRRYSIVVVAEGVGSAVDIGKEIGEKTGIDTRVTVLGHVQRGGSPTAEDRVKASMLGEKAALALLNGQSNIVFGINEGKVVAIDLHDSVNNNKTLDPELVRLARVLSK